MRSRRRLPGGAAVGLLVLPLSSLLLLIPFLLLHPLRAQQPHSTSLRAPSPPLRAARTRLWQRGFGNAKRREVGASVKKSPSEADLGFSFSASGLMMPYHIGVGKALRDAGVLTDKTPLAGASGGAIAAAALACGLPSEVIMDGIEAVAEDCRVNGAFQRMLVPARELCQQVLPEDAHSRMNGGHVRIAVLQVLPRPKRMFVDSWDSKDDVVDSLMASSNIPALLAPTILVPFRNGLCVDGCFATRVGTFGCGDTAASRTVRVMALNPYHFGTFASAICEVPRDSIAPEIRSVGGLSLSTRECLQLAAGTPPPSPKVIKELYKAGYLAAEAWIDEEKELGMFKGRDI